MAKRKSSTANLLTRFLPLTLLVLGFVLFFYFQGYNYINLETLREQQANLQALKERLGILAPLVYGVLYALVVAFSLPLGTVMSLAAGLLFGILLGTATVVLAATLGACGVYLAVRLGLGKSLDFSGKDGVMAKMQDGFNRNATSYLLLLRIVPVFPFALVNIVAALLRVPLPLYFITTLIGIIPGSAVYVSLGNGIAAIFAAGGTPNLGIIFEPQIIGPILALAALVLINLIYKNLNQKRKRLLKQSPPAKKPAKNSKQT